MVDGEAAGTGCQEPGDEQQGHEHGQPAPAALEAGVEIAPSLARPSGFPAMVRCPSDMGPPAERAISGFPTASTPRASMLRGRYPPTGGAVYGVIHVFRFVRASCPLRCRGAPVSEQ